MGAPARRTIGTSYIVDEPQNAPKRSPGFIGNILEKQGLSTRYRLFPNCARSFPRSIGCAGAGPYENSAASSRQELGVSDIVHFLGYVRDGQEILRLLSAAGIRLAPL